MKDLLFLDKMHTPKIMTFIYWLLLLGVLLFGLASMFGGFEGFTFGKMIRGLFAIAVGAVLLRVYCELVIIMFRMNEALQEIRNK